MRAIRLFLVGVALVAMGSRAAASYAVYVGKNLTADGSVFLAGYGDEPSSHWLEIVPRMTHKPGTTMTVGVTAAATYPGELMQIPQAETTFRFLTMNYSAFAGFPAPLTNGGLNEHLVAARDVWSPSRDELRKMTPKPQRGPSYSDLSRIAMQRARTAREAVEIVGGLIDKYGYSTYGGNSHLFADADEGWVFINFAGGQGLWVAERLGPDAIRVSRPGYIGVVPKNFREHPDFRGSENLISFAVQQGWYDPASGEPFHVGKIYGQAEKAPAVDLIEKRLAGRAGKIALKDMMEVVRTTEVTRDSAGYGQVAHLKKGQRAELGTLWVAATTPVAAPFIPYRLGATDVPPEFKQHRYLTAGEAEKFIGDNLGLESTKSAFAVFKRLFYLTSAHQDRFLPEVNEALVAFEARLIAEQETVEKTALALYEAGHDGLAAKYLTYYSSTEALNGLRLGEDLAASLEARTKILFGIRGPKGDPGGTP
jgi:dipeptidase